MENEILIQQKILLDVLANSLFGANREIPDEVEWKYVCRESRLQAVDLFVNLDEKQNISEIVKERWNDAQLNHFCGNITVEYNHNYLHKLMTDNGIKYCILKGCSSQYYYADKSLRAMGDVDFLISKNDIEKATEVLKNDGFEPWNEEHICHIVFRKDNIHLEMHFEPAGVPNGIAGEKVREYFNDVFDKSELITTDEFTFVKPSDFHHGLILLLHTYHHLLSEGIGLRHLCDWAVFANSFTNDKFLALFSEKLTEIGLMKFAQILSCVASIYLGLPYREWMGNIDEDLCKKVMCDIFDGGNFGVKDKARSKQGMAISDRGKDGVGKKSKLYQTLSSINKITCTQFRIMNKVVILRPFGWFFIVARYCVRVIFGKREKINVVEVLKDAETRREIYKQFELFEIPKK